VVEGPVLGSLWRQPSFLRLWSSETISSFGAQFSELAIPLTAVLVLQGTPAELGILNAAVTAPFLIFSLLAGVWVDQHRRRSIMILSNIGRGLLLAIIPIAAATGTLTIPLLLGVAFLVGSLRVFFDIAYQSLLPELVQRAELVDANSRLEASRSVSSVAGPGIAGLVIQSITAPFAIAFDAVSFIFSTLFLSGIRTQEAQFDYAERPSILSEIREGIQVVFNDARLRSLAGAAATANFFEFAIQALFLLYAVNALALQPSELGLILGAGAVGAVVGALVAGKLSEWIGVGPSIMVSMILGASIWGPMIYFASRPTAIPFLIVAWFFGEVSFVSWSINQSSFRQAICSTGMQGRVSATMRFLTVGVVPVGSIVGGVLGEIVGLHAAIGVAAIGLVLAPLWILLSPIWKVKNVLDEKTVG
jgi:MFS family permease